VVPLYPTSGPFWNDYVKADGTTRFDATDTACDPASDGPTYEACIHAGEVRALRVPGASSCAGLTATDALGAFDWTCIVKAGQAWVVSSALKPAKHLADLIDFTAGVLRTNSLTVTSGGSTLAASAPAVWWANPVRSEKAGIASGGVVAVHTIVIAPVGSAGRYYVNAQKAAMVVEPGTTVTGDMNVTGSFAWVEGRFQNQSTASVGGGSFSVIRGLRSDGSLGSGVTIQTCKACVATDLEGNRASSVAAGGSNISLAKLTGCRIQRATSVGSLKHGILLGDITSSVLEDFTDTNSANIGLGSLRVVGSTLRRLSVQGSGGDGYQLYDTMTSTFDDVSLNQAGTYGYYLSSSASGPGSRAINGGNRFRRVRAIGAQLEGISIRGEVNATVFDDVLVADNGRGNSVGGLYVGSGPAMSFYNVRVSGSSDGVHIGSYPARFANVITSGTDIGLRAFPPAGGHVLQNVTAVDGSVRNVYSQGRTGTYSNVLSVNGGVGWLGDGTSLGTFPQLNFNSVVTDNATAGISLALNIDWFQFSGVLKVGSNAGSGDCSIVAGAKGITNACAMANGSTAAVTVGGSAAATFVGRVASDAANTTDTAGAATYATTLDFSAFDNPERAWGLAGAGAWPHVSQQGPCKGTSACAIYDWSLRAADTLARNITPLPSGNDTLTSIYVNTPSPTAQANCDYDDPGTVFSTTPIAHCETTFLRGAVEIVDDGIGDDDTLCESNETCLYSPNAGGYQGHGSLISAGAFTPGTLTGITLVRYETNGR
jgi:hypothetical protein